MRIENENLSTFYTLFRRGFKVFAVMFVAGTLQFFFNIFGRVLRVFSDSTLILVVVSLTGFVLSVVLVGYLVKRLWGWN